MTTCEFAIMPQRHSHISQLFHILNKSGYHNLNNSTIAVIEGNRHEQQNDSCNYTVNNVTTKRHCVMCLKMLEYILKNENMKGIMQKSTFECYGIVVEITFLGEL